MRAHFSEIVRKYGTKEAVVDETGAFTYLEVDKMSDAVAERILGISEEKGDAVAVLFPRRKEIVVAGLACFKSERAYLPLDDTNPADRIITILENAKARVLITTKGLYEEKELTYPLNRTIFLEDWVEICNGKAGAGLSKENGTEENYRALIIFTSGTTGKPKGVVHYRDALLDLLLHMSRRKGASFPPEQTRGAEIASFAFIASVPLLYGVMFAGGTSFIIPAEIRTDMAALYQFIRKNQINEIFMPPRMAAPMLEKYDLSGVRVLTGGDRAQRFTACAPAEVYNKYGSSEDLEVASCRIRGDEKEIPIGYPDEGVRVAIVDDSLKEVPRGEVGELIIHSKSMATEYLNNPELTAQKWFTYQGERYYRTGDRMWMDEKGLLYYVGRLDFMVKLRGFRVETGEVEQSVLTSSFRDQIRAAVCIVQNIAGEDYLCLYYESDEPVDEEVLRDELSHQLTSYMVPTFFIHMDTLPRNANGKLDRNNLPVPELDEDEVYYTSLEAMSFVADVYEQYGVKIDYRKVLGHHSQKELDEIVRQAVDDEAGDNGRTVDESTPEYTEAPLTFSQIGVYLDCVADPDSTAYNLPMLIDLPNNVDSEAVRQALRKIFRAHPCLNVRIRKDRNGNAIMKLEGEADTGDSFCPERDVTEEELCNTKSLFRPFDLDSDEPLYRMEILKKENGERLLFIDFHHLIFDGTTGRLFLGDLCKALRGEALRGEEMSLIDYARKQAEFAESEERDREKPYWDSRMAVTDEMTEVLPDLYETKEQNGEEKMISAHLPEGIVSTYCRKTRVRSSAVYLASALYTIAAFTGEERLGIVMSSGSRQRLEIANTYGMFVNTLPVTAAVPTGNTEDFIRQMSELLGEMVEHDNYPFAKIASDYRVRPLIMFACQESLLEESDEEIFPYRIIDAGPAKFPLLMEVTGNGIETELLIKYDSLKYSPYLAESFLKCWQRVLMQMLTTDCLEEISFIDEEEKIRQDEILTTPCHNQKIGENETVLSLLEKSFENFGERTAVVFEDIQITYQELEERTRKLAGQILRRMEESGRVEKEPVAAILIPRDENMVIASVAALRAGCAYQPMPSDYPDERLQYMISDSNAVVLITTHELGGRLGDYKGQVIYLEDPEEDVKDVPLPERTTPENLFILLYTSGTTGKPKGVMLEHQNLVSFIRWYLWYYSVDEESAVAAYASFGFDACMMDLFPALAAGASVHIIPEEKRLDLEWIEAFFSDHRITHVFMTTQVGVQFAKRFHPKRMKHFSTGGEKMESLDPPEGYCLYNGYGPTECSIFSTIYQVEKREANIPIGLPLDEVSCVIADRYLRRLPEGALGELIIRGKHVGRGYLNLPEKTAEAFFIMDGMRAYHSSDIVRMRHDGNIVYVNRRDGQIKIRGFRIELKEVEEAILSFAGVRDAVVCAFDEPGGSGKYLAAYVVAESGTTLDMEALKQHILDEKPAYMLPKYIMEIDEIPLNQNQKVDKRALPVPQMTGGEYVAPEDDVQKTIVDAISKVLGIDGQISITDDFISLGGDSVRAMTLITELSDRGVTVGTKSVLQGSSIAALADEAKRNVQIIKEKEAVSAEDADLSDEEMERLREQFSRRGEQILKIRKINDEQYDNIYKYILGRDSGAKIKAAIFEIDGDLPPEVLKEAQDEIYDRFEEMRTVIYYAGGEDFYTVVTDKKPLLEVTDLGCSAASDRELSEKEVYGKVLELREKMLRAPYRMQEDPPATIQLVRAAGRKSYLIACIHVLAYSRTIYRNILAELFSVLDERTNHRTNLGEWAEMIRLANEAEGLKNGDGKETASARGERQRGLERVQAESDLYVYHNEDGLKKLIFVHTMNTGSEAYYLLAKKLEGKKSFAVFEQYNLQHPDQPIFGIENIAAKYIEILKEFQPEGPYQLGGWCYGGTIAYEMAQQLTRAGEIVEELILLDTFIVDDPEVRERQRELSTNNADLRNYLASEPLFEDMRKKGYLEQLIINSENAAEAWIMYDTKPYDGKVLYFKATQIANNLSAGQDELFHYAQEEQAGGFEFRVSKENLTIVPVPTEHDSMMNEESLKIIVPYLID